MVSRLDGLVPPPVVRLGSFDGQRRHRIYNGLVRLAASVGPWQLGRHDDVTQPLPRLPFPGGGDRARGLAVSLLQPQPNVETILAARGVVVSYKSIREWGLRFGRLFANTLKRRRPKPGDKWHLDEVFIRIRGSVHYLWRAVDQHGVVLDVLVQSRRNAKAAKRLARKFDQAAL